MMYKIINKNTGNEFICNKVTIEGFDYYHTLEKECVLIDGTFIFKSNNQMITCLAGSKYGFVKTIGTYYKIIATTNPNIECYLITDDGNVLSNICDDEIILTMVHELDNARDEWLKYREKRLSTMGNSQYWNEDESEKSFVDGYQRAKEQYQLTGALS